MIAGARRLPVQHLSIRVPWHDNGWSGNVCTNPAGNVACRALSRVAETKDEAAEAAVAGRPMAELPREQLPACWNERAGFMSSTPLPVVREHPYVGNNSDSHGHFAPTPHILRPFSAACIPFRWMLKEQAEEIAELYDLDYQPEREPDLGFDTVWVQERRNQLALLDTFFSATVPEESLCFFYAKDTPLSAAAGRVIIGVGLVRSVDEHVEYQYATKTPPLRSVLWERNLEHSIRPGFEEGFLFPYAELFDLALEQGLDPEEFLALAPDDAFWGFAYASEHVSHHHAIATVLSRGNSGWQPRLSAGALHQDRRTHRQDGEKAPGSEEPRARGQARFLRRGGWGHRQADAR